MERIMIVPLRKARRGTKEKFASKAVKYLRAFVSRHMKAGSTLIGSDLNEFIWRNGMRNPPRRVEIKSTVKDGVAFAELSSVSTADWKAFLARGKEEPVKKKKKAEKKEEKKTKKETKKTTKKSEKKTEKKSVKKATKKTAEKKKETKKPVKKAAKKTTKKEAKKPVKKAEKKATKKTTKSRAAGKKPAAKTTKAKK